MKKIFAIVLGLAMVMSLVACGAEETETTPEQTEETTGEEPAVSVWKAFDGTTEGNISDDVKEVVDKALDGFEGVGYTPIALLGTQVVAGLNYRVLCKSTVIVPGAEPSLSVITIYKDLEGNASITDVADFDIDALVSAELPEEGLVGGWTEFVDTPTCTLDADVQAALDAAKEGFVGSAIEPVAVLARLSVGGGGYALLAKCSAVVPDAAAHLQVVTVVSDNDGYTFGDFIQLNPADFSTK